jgi:hypothetical protein
MFNFLPKIEGLAQILGCRVAFLLWKYSGLPLLYIRISPPVMVLLKKMGSCLAGWKMPYLSRGYIDLD